MKTIQKIPVFVEFCWFEWWGFTKVRDMFFFQPKKIHLSPETFTVENNLLTPTFKSKRPQLQERYQKEIDEMYEDLY